jgi:hypothetical protein
MTIADKQIKKLDTHSTSGSRTIGTATALSIAILCARYAPDRRMTTNLNIVLSGTSETNSQLQSLEVTDTDVANQLSRVYDELLRSQKDIDSETRRALYANLSDLYS